MSNDHSWTEYAASYALGALDPDEHAAFEAHLGGCAACRAEAQAYQEVTGLLAHAAPQVAAPPALKTRVLEAARGVRPITATRKRRAAFASEWLPWLAAAALLVIAAGMGVLYNAEHDERVRATNAALAAQSQLAQARSDAARSDSTMAALLAPDVQTATLAAQGRPPSARVYYNRSRRVVVVATFDLPPAPDGRTYQLWGISGTNKPVSLGLFNTPESGRGITTLRVPAGSQFDVTAVTEEPAGGSAQPTTAPFLVGNFSL